MNECKTIRESMNFIAGYIEKISRNLPENTFNLINNIEKTQKRIFLIGAGRSGLEARAFAMRLMHLGFNSHVIGELSPIPDKEDLVVIISGSGNTKSIINLVKKIQNTKIIIITTKNHSELGNMSDISIIIPIDNENNEIQPMGTIFEAVVHTFLDGVIAELKTRSEVSEDDMKFRHLLSEYVGAI